MSINRVAFKEALSQLPERKSLFFVPKDSVKYVRFVNQFESFFAVKLHKKYDDLNGKYDTSLCYNEDCPYCLNEVSTAEFFLPIYECDENGTLEVQKEKLWQLPYGNLYYQICNTAGQPVKDNIKKFVVRIERVNSKYKFEYKYVYPDYENLDNGIRVNTDRDWNDFLVSIYGDETVKNNNKTNNRLAQVLDDTIKTIDNNQFNNGIASPTPSNTFSSSSLTK